MDQDAEAYAALVHIQAGDWDAHLLRLLAAIRARLFPVPIVVQLEEEE